MVSEEKKKKKLAFTKFRVGGKIQVDCYLFTIQGGWLFWFGSLVHKPEVFTFFEMKKFTPEEPLSYLENKIA